MSRILAFAATLLVLALSRTLEGDEAGANLLRGDFESGVPTYNPWGGVDSQGNLRVWAGSQLAVDDTGDVGNISFSPSVAVGDLNGDGLPDLVVADARGFFWFFANSGQPGAPVFTHGEIMPIWLDDVVSDKDVVPRIQMLDFTGEKKLGIVAGNFAGQLYYIHNQGSATAPAFRMPKDFKTIQVPTHTGGLLWCNYVAPFLFDWSGTQRLDLVMGDGTYSANSIHLFTNSGTNDRPNFNEQHLTKIIAGMGREHLTPQVVDWNNDGKPDIIAGERVGYIDVYLNKATANSGLPEFDPENPMHVTFGMTDKVGPLPTICVADLNNDKLFDLVVGTADGRICYSLNTGTPGHPQFGPLVPLKGVLPFANIITPNTWQVTRYIPFGAPYELLECTNAKIEPGFTPPPEPFKGQGALKFSIVNPNNKYFKEEYYPENVRSDGKMVDTRRMIQYVGGISIQSDTRYTVSFWARGQGNISNFTWEAKSHLPATQASEELDGIIDGQIISLGEEWSHVSQTLEFKSQTDERNIKMGMSLFLVWEGDGTIYFDDFSLKKAD